MLSLTITDSAAEALIEQAEEKGKAPTLRLGLRGGGCTGFSYIIEWGGPVPDATDQVFEHNGARVFVDPKSLVYLSGSELDFEKTLMGHGFKINNPQVTGSCGCGASVQF